MLVLVFLSCTCTFFPVVFSAAAEIQRMQADSRHAWTQDALCVDPRRRLLQKGMLVRLQHWLDATDCYIQRWDVCLSVVRRSACL